MLLEVVVVVVVVGAVVAVVAVIAAETDALVATVPTTALTNWSASKFEGLGDEAEMAAEDEIEQGDWGACCGCCLRELWELQARLRWPLCWFAGCLAALFTEWPFATGTVDPDRCRSTEWFWGKKRVSR